MCFYNYTHRLVKIKPELGNVLTTDKTELSTDFLYQTLLKWERYFITDLVPTPDFKYYKAKVNSMVLAQE